MAKAPSPKAEQLRALREAKHSQPAKTKKLTPYAGKPPANQNKTRGKK